METQGERMEYLERVEFLFIVKTNKKNNFFTKILNIRKNLLSL